MKAKRIASLVLSSALALSLSAPAFAADDSTEVTDLANGANVEISGETKIPTIKVTVPTTGSVIVNPFELKVTVGDDEVTDQIISAPQFINSVSDVKLKVSAKVTGTVGGEVKLASESAKAATTKSAFVYFEMATANDGDTEPTWASAFDAAKHVALTTKATAVPEGGEVELNAKVDANDTTGTFAAFHLAGDAAANLAKGNWTAADTVSASIAFTFTPVVTSGS